MYLSKLFVWFIVYSFMGWVYESIFCTIKNRQWENRGFLHGPIVPIYGVGALLASIVFSSLPVESLQQASSLSIFLICFLGSIVLEYFTSWALEKLFHAYWWDYSNVPLNIHGRVCLFASIGFGVAGILVVRVLFPFVSHITSGISPFWMEFLSLFFMLLFGMDMALTISALTNFTKNFNRIENEINEQIAAAYDKLYSSVSGAIESVKEKSSAFQESAAAKKELAGEKVSATKELAEEKVAALREQLTRERLEALFASSSYAQKRTMLGVQGFRKDKDKDTGIRQRMRTMIDEKRPHKKR